MSKYNLIANGLGAGNSLDALVASNYDVRVLRPWMGDDGSCFIDNSSGGVTPIANATLRKDEWLQLDKAMIEIAQKRMNGVNDLRSAGLVRPINGMGTTILEWETSSDLGDAEISMDAKTRAQNERLTFEIESLPLPFTHKAFQMNMRFLTTSRRGGSNIDTSQVRMATEKVAQNVERRLFNGWGNYTYGGATIYGYTDYPWRNMGTLAAPWTASGTTGVMIVADVTAMKQKAIEAKKYGPYKLYISALVETRLDDDYKSQTDRGLRERIMAIQGIESITVSDYLPPGDVLLIQMDRSTIEMVEGMPMTNIQWEEGGSFAKHFKVMTIMVPKIMKDQDGNNGIVHFVDPAP